MGSQDFVEPLYLSKNEFMEVAESVKVKSSCPSGIKPGKTYEFMDSERRVVYITPVKINDPAAEYKYYDTKFSLHGKTIFKIFAEEDPEYVEIVCDNYTLYSSLLDEVKSLTGLDVDNDGHFILKRSNCAPIKISTIEGCDYIPDFGFIGWVDENSVVVNENKRME